MTTDQDLIGAYQRGDSSAGELLVDRYYGMVLGFFRNKSPSNAYDLTQQTFMECFLGLSRLQDATRLRSFLFGIACNLLRSHFRRLHGDRLDFQTASAVDLDPSPSLVVAQNQTHQQRVDSLRSIPVEYQLVLELPYWEDLSSQEVADVLALPLGTVKTRLRKGRQLLAERLEAEGEVSEAALRLVVAGR